MSGTWNDYYDRYLARPIPTKYILTGDIQAIEDLRPPRPPTGETTGMPLKSAEPPSIESLLNLEYEELIKKKTSEHASYLKKHEEYMAEHAKKMKEYENLSQTLSLEKQRSLEGWTDTYLKLVASFSAAVAAKQTIWEIRVNETHGQGEKPPSVTSEVERRAIHYFIQVARAKGWCIEYRTNVGEIESVVTGWGRRDRSYHIYDLLFCDLQPKT